MSFPKTSIFRKFIPHARPTTLTKVLVSMICFSLTFSGVFIMPGIALAQVSLKDVEVKEPPNLNDFIKDKQAAIALGKALFWDMQVGSDGVQACASCHFHAGADHRSKNQINPGTNAGDTVFGNSGIPGIPAVPGLPQLAPNYQMKASDFPFHSRDAETRGVPRPPLPGAEFGNVVRDCNDVMSSQGVRWEKFLGVMRGNDEDLGKPQDDPVFHLKYMKTNIRRVEPRNTPTVINAVFNGDNFWEGRASMIFNGVNPFGFRDRTSTLKKNANGTLTDVSVRIPFSSLASQAVGPPVSDFEMSFIGRDFPSIGRKMLSLRPLAKQLVHPQDSVLGALSCAYLFHDRVVGGEAGSRLKITPQWSKRRLRMNGGTQMILSTLTRTRSTCIFRKDRTPGTLRSISARVGTTSASQESPWVRMSSPKWSITSPCSLDWRCSSTKPPWWRTIPPSISSRELL